MVVAALDSRPINHLGRPWNETAVLSGVRFQKGGTDPCIPIVVVPCPPRLLHQLRRLHSHGCTQIRGGTVSSQLGHYRPQFHDVFRDCIGSPIGRRAALQGLKLLQPCHRPLSASSNLSSSALVVLMWHLALTSTAVLRLRDKESGSRDGFPTRLPYGNSGYSLCDGPHPACGLYLTLRCRG